MNAYVDPTLHRVVPSELRGPDNPQPVRVTVEFQTNGKLNSKATIEASHKILTVLQGSKLFSSVAISGPSEMASMDIVMNNVGDSRAAVRKGVGTGLTFGLAGSLVTDEYVFTASYQVAGKAPLKRVYKHAIHTTIGAKKGPEGLQPMSIAQAFSQVVDDLVLNFLRDLQASGYL